MSLYTLKGSEALDQRIAADMQQITEQVAPHSLAGVLTGGYGRGEGTPFIHSDGSQAPFNDYDLVVVVDQLNRAVRQKLRQLEESLSSRLNIPVDLCPYRLSHLRRCERSLLNYEMKRGHRVVWGDPHILDALPDYSITDIPLSEGTRLLLNRGKLLLDMRQRLALSDPLSSEERIRFIKFIHKALLAFGDCALLVAGQYDVSYAVKKSRIREIGDVPDRDYIIEGYQQAIALKEWGDYQALTDYDIAEAFHTVRAVFLRFLPWYRAQYSTRECPVIKAMVLNLIWNRWPLLSHPRIRLYDALQELLQDEPDHILLGQILFCGRQIDARFRILHARFS